MSDKRHARVHVLVVEDDEVFRSTIVATLGRTLTVSEATNVVSARAVISSGSIDVLVSDFDLGTVDNGLTLLEEARRLSPSMRRILMTGTLPTDMALADDLCEIVFRKPFLVAALLRHIHAGAHPSRS